MKVRFVFFLFCSILVLPTSHSVYGQNVGINATGVTPNPSAILDVNVSPDNNEGLLIPRMADGQRKTLPNPAPGLIIYNTTSNTINFYNGTGWQQIDTLTVSHNSGSGSAINAGVAINATGASPSASALLDISSSTKGLLIPRTTTASVTAVNGLVIYNTSANAISVYNGSSWVTPCYSSIDNSTGTGAAGVGVAINSTGASPDPSAILDISSANKGILIPILTVIERDGLPSPSQGLMIYNSNDGAIEYWTGTLWNELSASGLSSVTATATPNPICINTSLTLTGSAVGATSWSWTGPNAFTANTQNCSVASFSVFDQGTYSLTVTGGCASSAAVTTSPVASSIMYVPVTLTNSQTSATLSGFQQMITVNSSNYTSSESTGLQNVEFSTSPGATGTILKAWIESGASNTATSTVYWVNLAGTTIPATNSGIIYMNFMPTNVMSSGGPTGEAPQLSASYAQNDNGSQVFIIYSDWSGTSLPAGWAVSQTNSTYSINNGLTITPTGGGSSFVYYNTPQSPVGYMLDAYFNNGTAASDGHDELIGWAQSPTSATTFEGGSGPGWWGWVNGVWMGLHQEQEVGATSAGSNTQPFGGPPVTTYPVIVTASWQSNSTNTGYYNYANVQPNTGTIPSITYANGYVPVGGYLSSGGNVTYYWFRERLYPPAGVMPTVSFGTLTCY